jgi:large subunit ribosomal protein L35
MSKQKTKRAAAKRFTFTGTGKIKRRSANHRHMMTGKPQSVKVQQRKDKIVFPGDAKLIIKMLPHGG